MFDWSFKIVFYWWRLDKEYIDAFAVKLLTLSLGALYETEYRVFQKYFYLGFSFSILVTYLQFSKICNLNCGDFDIDKIELEESNKFSGLFLLYYFRTMIVVPTLSCTYFPLTK